MLSRGRVIGLVLTLVFLVLALREVDLALLVAEFKSVNYLWLIPSAICTLLGYGVRTLRWQAILSGSARAPIRTLFPILIMGFATNNLLPGRLGEFWRAYLLGRKRNVRKTIGLASVFVERVFDGLVLIALLAVVSRMVDLPEWGRQVQTISALIFLGATVGVGLLLWAPNLAWAILRPLSRLLPTKLQTRIDGAFEAFLEGLSALRNPGVLLSATGLSIVVWGLEAASYYLLTKGVALDLTAANELPAMGLLLSAVNLGIMVPAAPGYFGTQEFFGRTALGVFGVGDAPALALVFVSHMVQYVLVTGLGLVFFAREHLSPASIGRVTAEAEAVG